MKKIYEMSESNLLLLCQIFHPNSKWESQKRFYYDQENKRKFYAVDVYSEDKRIVRSMRVPITIMMFGKSKEITKEKNILNVKGFCLEDGLIIVN